MLTQIKKLSVFVIFLFIASVSHADGYCQLKDLEHNVILQMYNAYTVNEACQMALNDCYSRTQQCGAWNSGERPYTPRPQFYCQLKDAEHNRVLRMFYGYTLNEACSYAQQDCYSQTNSCLGWNSGQVTN